MFVFLLASFTFVWSAFRLYYSLSETKDAEIGLLVVETIEAMYKSAKAGVVQPIPESGT